jgi:hypothetical protein
MNHIKASQLIELLRERIQITGKDLPVAILIGADNEGWPLVEAICSVAIHHIDGKKAGIFLATLNGYVASEEHCAKADLN